MTSDSEIRKLCEEVVDISNWPNCAVPGCRNKCCLSLDSTKCHPHTMQERLEAELETGKRAWKNARTWGSKQKKRADDAVAALREKIEAERKQEDGRYRAFAQAMRQWEMYADEQREESERIRETTDKEDIEAEMFQRFEATRFAWWKSLLPSAPEVKA